MGESITKEIPDPEKIYGNVTLEPPTPQVTGEEVLQQGMLRANAMKALANGIEQGFSPIIPMFTKSIQSQQSTTDQTPAAPSTQITRGPSGDMNVLPSLNLFGGSDTYANAAGKGALATAGTQADSDINAIRAKYQNDPEGFKTAASGYVANAGWDGLGPIGSQAKINAARTSNDIYNDMVLRKSASDLVDSKNAIGSQIWSTSSDMSALAKNGQLNSPQFDRLQDRLQDSYASLASNPASGLSKTDADDQFAQKLNGFLGDHVSSQIDTAYQAGGRAGALQAARDGVSSIPNLSDADRAQLAQRASSRVDYVSGLNSDAIQANRQAAGATKMAANAGLPVDPASYSVISSRAIQTGDPATVADIASHVPATSANPITNGLTPSQSSSALTANVPAPPPPVGGPTRQAAAYNYFVSNGWSPNAAHAMTATLSGESGRELFTGVYQSGNKVSGGVPWANYQPGYLPPGVGETSGGIANWNGARATAYKDWATSNRLDPDSFNSQLQYVDFEARKMGLPVTSTASPASLTSVFTGRYEAPTVNNGAARWANYSKENLSGGGAPASVNGQPLPADHPATPVAASPYVASVAADPNARANVANDLGGSIERSLQNHVLPAPETMAQYVQLAADNPKEQPRATRIASAAGFTPSTGGDTPQGGGSIPAMPGTAAGSAQPETYPQAVGRLAAGHDLFQAGIGSAVQQQHADAAAALAHDPVGYAVRAKLIDPSQAPGPIDYNDPASIAPALQARAAIVARVAAREPAMSLSAIPEAEKPQLASWLTYGPPQTGQAILDSIRSLPPASRDATFADPTIAKTVVNLARSPDVTRAGAANDLLTEAWKSNPQTFDHRFGDGASSDLAAWHSVGQFQSPEGRVEAAKASAQPAVIKARNDEIAVANKMTPQSIANALSPSWFGPNATPGDTLSGTALKGQYDDLFHEQYLKTADATAAKAYALGKLSTMWGVSSANDGRVMKYPPEYSSAYPPVDGSKNYIGKQLADDVATAAPGSTGHYLVGDQRTADEMASGAAPSYLVMFKDANGRWDALPSRFAADPEQAKADAAAKFGSRHDALGIISTTGLPSGHF